MGDYREEPLVQSRGTYLLIYNADRNKCSARTSTNWKLAPFKFQTKTISELDARPQKKSITAERRTQSLTRGGMTPSEKEELLRTVSCYGEEYSQVQECSHFI